MNLVGETFHALQGWGDRPVFVETGSGADRHEVSAGDLLSNIDQWSQLLEQAGVRAGHRVVLLLANGTQFVACFLAIVRIGAIAVPLKLESRELELAAIFTELDPEMVIAEAAAAADDNGHFADAGVIVVDSTAPTILRNVDRRGAAFPVDEGIASINYTYRGYGYPLGALVPGDQYLIGANDYAAFKFYGTDGNQAGRRMLVMLPMAHMFTLIGCVFMPLFRGITGVLTRTVHPRRVFETALREDVDYLTAVPELYRLFAAAEGGRDDLRGRFSIFGSGGSLLTLEDHERIEAAFDVEILHGYGLTEYAPISAHKHGYSRGGTIGEIMPAVACRIDDPDTFGVGEIVVRVPTMTRGYFRRPIETAEAFRDGWFRTGDLGKFDGDHLVFVREKKRTRKVNGLLVDLSEVEQAICAFDGVEAAEVVFENGRLSATITTDSRFEAAETVARVKKGLKSVMAGHKIPSIVSK